MEEAPLKKMKEEFENFRVLKFLRENEKVFVKCLRKCL